MDFHLLGSTITWQRFRSCQLCNYIEKKRYRQVTNGINDENITNKYERNKQLKNYAMNIYKNTCISKNCYPMCLHDKLQHHQARYGAIGSTFS